MPFFHNCAKLVHLKSIGKQGFDQTENAEECHSGYRGRPAFWRKSVYDFKAGTA